HLLEEGARVGILGFAALGHVLPVAVHHLLGALVAAERQVAVVVAVVDAEVPRLDRPEPRNPDRWMRLLDGLRPQIHVAQLRVLAVPGERLAPPPRPGCPRAR